MALRLPALMKLGAAVARGLQHFRHQSGLTQEELAARAGLNRNYIGMIEREENSPTVDTLEKLAAVLKIEPQLFFVDDEVISDAVGLQGSKSIHPQRASTCERRGRITTPTISSSGASPLSAFGLGGLAELGFFVLFEVVHVEVAVCFEPVLVGFDGKRSDEAAA